MEGERRGALRSRGSAQFKKKGGNRRERDRRWGGGGGDEFRENTQVPNPTDTVYRILCPSKKIGSVIGKGGGIIKVLREETRSKITVSDTISGSDERVIMIYSPPEKVEDKGDGSEGEFAVLHCAAQDALLRVHDRIVEEDLVGGEVENGGGEDDGLVVRLLVPNNMVGCLIGKGGDVIQRLRTETGASIRVLPSEHLPSCALRTDELVQLQGNPKVLKRALYEVSTLLHQNPRKERALNVAIPFHGPGFHPAGPPVSHLPPPRDPMWSPRNSSPRMPPPPWREDFGHPMFRPGGFDDDIPRPGVEPSGEFSMKILCLASKIGGVIGKGGMNVRQLEMETGTSIHVEDASALSEERIIRISAFESLHIQRSQTIDAILLLQNRVSEVSEKGVITTRLLVPSSKVGCLLGQGGTIINEMRRRSHADIRVYAKDEKPKCASEDEELVQVSGSFAVAKDALAEIASRLRARCLRDGSVGAEPAPLPPPRPVPRYDPGGSYPSGGPPAHGPVGVGSSAGYHHVKGGMHNYDYESPGYPVPTSASRYANSNSSVEGHYSNSSIGPVPGAESRFYSDTQMPEAPRTRLKPQDPYYGHSEPLTDIHSGPDPYSRASSVHHNFGGQNNPYQGANANNYGGQNNPYQGAHANLNGPASYQGMTPAQAPYQSSQYQNPHQIPYQQSPYRNTNAQHSTYQNVAAPGTYQY